MKRAHLLATALLLSAYVSTLSSPARADDNPPILKLGAKAPNVRLPGVDGKTYTLGDFAKSPVLVVLFTCNHCPTAQAYEDRIIAVVNDYKDKGVAVVAISPNDPKSVRLDELGRILIETSHGVALVDDRDIESMSDWITAANTAFSDEDELIAAIEDLHRGGLADLRIQYAANAVPLRPIIAADVPARLRFVPHPRSTTGEVTCT